MYSLKAIFCGQDPDTNPYGLADRLKYYHLEVENWKSSYHRKSHRSHSRHRKDSSGKDENTEELASSDGNIASKRYSLSRGIPQPDTGLASISDPSSSSRLPASPSSSSSRPPFPLSLSTSNVVHSYIPPTSPPSQLTSHERRRQSIGYFNLAQTRTDSSSSPQQQPDNDTSNSKTIDSTLAWTSTPE